MTEVSMLVNYGVLGAWTMYLLYEKKIMLDKIVTALSELSEAIKIHGEEH